ncbi:D-lyxose/D-mannose family sugar isomerase [Desulfovibrio inopinatus]|uniref:D-lyxose/D-mannose family sugar isomerase n=1 Tax=Desulfovibrio inopinatus TaxID=102109 RepID=UPI00041AEC34|nr:D-lyxose/D-mannose family sugar isomerase [Desulfovibrio inopinatus]
MKRSEINRRIQDAEAFFDSMNFKLPPWAHWTADQWKGLGDSEVVHHMLGWDLTDYGKGEFDKTGLILFTLRNGKLGDPNAKTYAEKIMIVGENQICPMHFHWNKREDIINRGGGNLVIELYSSTQDEELSNEPTTINVDGIVRIVEPGGTIVLTPGESVCLEPGMYHRFYGETGKGRVMVGEVSSVNDDNTDNRFHESMPRFPAIEEDEPAYRLLVTDYPNYV